MPELPEVETLARQLRAPCVGRRIEEVTLRWPRHVATPGPREFKRRIQGQEILDINRRGKYLVFALTTDTLLIHLKMSGDLEIFPAESPRSKHDHTVFSLDDGRELRFNDTRKFGRVYLVGRPEEITGHLGPEPLDRKFTAINFSEILTAHHRPLKVLLLDQTAIAGVGNIYADESLYRARLHPERRSDTLTQDEARALWRSVRHILNAAIKHNGSSIDWVYRGGEHQNHFRVYDRAGEPCFNCGAPIRRITLGGRGTHFCPHCQRP